MVMQQNHSIEKKEFGYSESTSTTVKNRSDVGDDGYIKSKIDNIFKSGDLTQTFAQNDPRHDTVDTTLGLRDMIDPEQQMSALDQIGEEIGVDWNVNIDTASMMRTSTEALPDGAKVADQREGGFDVVEEKLACQGAAWDCAKGQAIESLKEAASGHADSDITPESAVNSIVAPETRGLGKLDAAATGLGTAVTGVSGGAAYVAKEVFEDRKDLSKEQKESLMNEAYQMAQSGGPTDTRASAAPKNFSVAGKEYELDIANLDEHAFDTVLTETLDQQDEHQYLLGELANLRDVEANHNYVADHIGDVNVEHKTEVAAASGREWASSIINDATVLVDADRVQAAAYSTEGMMIVFPDGGEAANNAYHFDNVSEIKDAMVAKYSEVETKVEMNAPERQLAQGNLVADAHAQLRVG